MGVCHGFQHPTVQIFVYLDTEDEIFRGRNTILYPNLNGTCFCVTAGHGGFHLKLLLDLVS